MDFKLQGSLVTERHNYLTNLLEYTEAIREAIKNKDADLVERLQRDFDHILEQLKFVGKRSKTE